MTPDKFRALTDLHSADLSRWPRELVRPALDFMAQDAGAKAYFDDALALDALLRAYVPAPLADPAALEDRIVAAARAPAKSAFRVPLLALFAPGGGLVAALVLGFFIGLHPGASGAEALLSQAVWAPEQAVAGDDIVLNDEGMF